MQHPTDVKANIKRSTRNGSDRGDVWFVYDGECPICKMGADMYRIRQAMGELHIVDARQQKDHPLMLEINRAGLDLDEGMVLKFKDRLYHGDEALKLMARLGEDKNWMNYIINRLGRYDFLARFSYPLLKAGRNLLLWLKQVDQIRNLDHS